VNGDHVVELLLGHLAHRGIAGDAALFTMTLNDPNAAVAASSRPTMSVSEATSQPTPIASVLSEAAASLALASSRSPMTIWAPVVGESRGDRQSDALSASGDDGSPSAEHCGSFRHRDTV